MDSKQNSFAAAIPPPSNTLVAPIRIHLSRSLLHSPLTPSSFTLARPQLLSAGLPPCEPVGASGCRGRATSGRLLLRRPFSTADKPPSAGNSKPGMLLCSKFRPGASGSNLKKRRGLTAKSVTQMNSADKDLFAVNLLNLWKFIVIHRKFVK